MKNICAFLTQIFSIVIIKMDGIIWQVFYYIFGSNSQDIEIVMPYMTGIKIQDYEDIR